MLPNVWTVKEFIEQSNKVFSTARSVQLLAIDQALGRAHANDPRTEAGVAAMLDVLNAIAAWRMFKGTKISGRAKAVDILQAQLASTSEFIYKRKIAKANNVVASTWSKMIRQHHAAKPLPKEPPLPALIPPMFPQRNATEDRLFDMLAQAMITRRQHVMAFDDEDLFDDLDVRQQGRLAARWMLSLSNGVKDVNAARGEALRILAAMLGNDISVIKNLLSNNVEVVVIGKDEGMTAVKQFEELSGVKTFDGRSWDTVRGVGNVRTESAAASTELNVLQGSGKKAASVVAIDPTKGRIYTAVTEENLLGDLTTAPGGGCYDRGYSTTTHEFAHAIHKYGLSLADQTIITNAFNAKSQQPDTTQWVDGPRIVKGQKCYAANNETEYFAQLSNAWLGVNMGTDPYTRQPRNNGQQWVRNNEPREIVNLFERIYGEKALEDLNPSVVLKS